MSRIEKKNGFQQKKIIYNFTKKSYTLRKLNIAGGKGSEALFKIGGIDREAETITFNTENFQLSKTITFFGEV